VVNGQSEIAIGNSPIACLQSFIYPIENMKLFTIPNFMTLCNLLCGCLGILSVFEGNMISASMFIGIALLLDFGDGFAARLLNSASPIGKELDSLADVVSFGALPSFMLFNELINNELTNGWISYIAFVMALSSALRLAKFNVDTRQSDSFIGVPTPANAMVVAALPLIQMYQPTYAAFITPWVILIYIVVMSYLLISELPLFALKFKSYAWAANRYVYSFLIASVVLLIIFQYFAVPLIILLYVGISLVRR
jgi:CDP-diacylglycerol--serine O-phosphatidyltransferase